MEGFLWLIAMLDESMMSRARLDYVWRCLVDGLIGPSMVVHDGST